MAEELNETKLTFTQEELDKLIQSEGDKRVTQAMKSLEKKNQDKIAEAEKLARMNEQEKFQYELDKREKEIAEREERLALAESKNEASKILAEKGLSLSLVDLIVNKDAEAMNANIKLLDKAFKDSVKNEVERRLAQGAPTNPPTANNGMTKEQFRKLSIAEQQRIYNSDKELYNSLI